MNHNKIYLFLLVFVTFSCSNSKKNNPDWIKPFPLTGQYVVTSIEDTIIFSDLISFDYLEDGVSRMLSTHQREPRIVDRSIKWNKRRSDTVLLFEEKSICFSKEYDSLGILRNYLPHYDLMRYPYRNCVDSVNVWISIFFGCECEYLITSNYKGYGISLSYFYRRTSLTYDPKQQELKFIISNDKEYKEFMLAPISEMYDGNIDYFVVNNAIYLSYYYWDEYYNNENHVIVKYSFDKLIEQMIK